MSTSVVITLDSDWKRSWTFLCQI